MAAYELTHEVPTGIIKCRIIGAISDADARKLATELRDAIVDARRRAPVVRTLFDNREGSSFSSEAIQALINQLQLSYEPGDRTATLVPSSLMKVQARQTTREGREIFISESAALTWLNAWE